MATKKLNFDYTMRYSYPIKLIFMDAVLQALKSKNNSEIYDIASKLHVRYTNMTKLRHYIKFLESHGFLKLRPAIGSVAIKYTITSAGRKFHKLVKNAIKAGILS